VHDLLEAERSQSTGITTVFVFWMLSFLHFYVWPRPTLVEVALLTQNQASYRVRDFDFFCYLYLMKHRNMKARGGVEL
jgi:hypothetical protein